MPPRGDLYSVLQVSKTASHGQIKKAYRILALKLHPDRHGGDPKKTAQFKRATDAYAILADHEKREAYDDEIGNTGFGPIHGFSPRSGGKAGKPQGSPFGKDIPRHKQGPGPGGRFYNNDEHAAFHYAYEAERQFVEADRARRDELRAKIMEDVFGGDVGSAGSFWKQQPAGMKGLTWQERIINDLHSRRQDRIERQDSDERMAAAKFKQRRSPRDGCVVQ